MRPVWFLGRELTISAALSWFVLVLLVVTIMIPGLPYATLDLVLSSVNSVGLTVAAVVFERASQVGHAVGCPLLDRPIDPS